MKHLLRAFAISVVLTGAVAATLSAPTTRVMASDQTGPESMPVPICGPWAPCPPDQPPSHLRLR